MASFEQTRVLLWISLLVAPFSRDEAGFGRTSGADDPESRLWTFTNASTLPVRVTTRVCTGGERVSPLPLFLLFLPLPSSATSFLHLPPHPFYSTTLHTAAFFFAVLRPLGPPRGEADHSILPLIRLLSVLLFIRRHTST